MASPLSVGLAGYGLAGQYLHAPLIRAAGMTIRAVVSSRREQIAHDLPTVDVTTDFQDLLVRNDIDLVVLATPNELHFPQAMAALEAGKHVVIDKPFCVTTSEADRLIEAADRRNLKLSCYHNRRWDSDYLTVRKQIESGSLGEIFSFHARWDRFRIEVRDRWREQPGHGAGLLYDLGPHLLDQAVQLFGRPEWIQADVFIQRSGGVVDDGFEIWMGKGPLRISLAANSIVADGGYRYRVNGRKGSFLKPGLDVQEVHIRRSMDPSAEGFGIEPESGWGIRIDPNGGRTSVTPEAGSWRTFYLMMADAITNGGPLPVEPSSAREIVELIEAAVLSARQSCRVSLQ
ncbi:Gfo/Idh/MocA family oxidoreductase [Microvirga sp. ACRRW]|uniref:Gfo/Idh/MocA family oxidoreductase n=1 Tax=Microvirga sp. ACRRW TaxID=2918205 RepID=UPI001EF5E1AF|nr:Gfo/Idh/MocA family oxidoreductase [Microvirga sp. ACRRW]MCG7394257.1 Gfo/Idh/MocA family oxidoreductase [Microvirga sp. ACRRW]